MDNSVPILCAISEQAHIGEMCITNMHWEAVAKICRIRSTAKILQTTPRFAYSSAFFVVVQSAFFNINSIYEYTMRTLNQIYPMNMMCLARNSSRSSINGIWRIADVQ